MAVLLFVDRIYDYISYDNQSIAILRFYFTVTEINVLRIAENAIDRSLHWSYYTPIVSSLLSHFA